MASYFTLLNGKGFDSLTVKPYTIFITKHSVSLYIRRFSEIVNVIIPFFDKHPILGVKSLDFADSRLSRPLLASHPTGSTAPSLPCAEQYVHP